MLTAMGFGTDAAEAAPENPYVPSALPRALVTAALQVSMLTAMGFEADAAEAALTATGGNVERAGDWLFSHMDDLAAAVTAVKGGAAAAAAGGGGGTDAAAAGNR
jgi:hypothetical protein